VSTVNTYCSLFVLLAAAIDDVMTRKVHNVLLGCLAVISIIVIFYFNGSFGLQQSAMGMLAGFMLYLPLAWLGVVGGGDLKLLSVVGITAGVSATVTIGLIALVWGAILGLFQVTLNGGLKDVWLNIVSLTKFKSPVPAKLHKIPFAAAILLGGLTEWTMNHFGGGL